MHAQTLYDLPALYDRLVPPGPCESFYAGLAPPGASVLDLGCGSGRLTVPLAAGGRDVTGLDASAAMLDAAAAKARDAGADVRWIRGDMSAFDLGRRFDLVMISCNSLAHMTTDEALSGCLQAVRNHLRPGGVFAFDVVNPKRDRLQRPPKPRLKRAPPESGLKVRETAVFDPETRISRTTWQVHDGHGAVREVEFALRQFLPDELPAALQAADLRLTDRFGEFDRSAYRASASRLQVGLAAAA